MIYIRFKIQEIPKKCIASGHLSFQIQASVKHVKLGLTKVINSTVITRGTTSQRLGSISFSFFFFLHVAISDSVQ